MKNPARVVLSLLVLLTAFTSFSQDYVELAKQAYNDKKYYDVVEYANKALNTTSSGSAYWYRAMGRYQLKNYIDASSDFTSAIAYYSTDNTSLGKLYYWRGLCKYNQSNYTAALPDFESCASYGYEYKTDLYWHLAWCNFKVQQYNKAIEQYSTAINYASDNATFSSLYKERADCKRSQSNCKEAVADYTKAIEYNSANSGAYWNRGVCRATNLDHEMAQADYTSAINLLEKDPSTAPSDIAILFSNRGYQKYMLSKNDEAKADLQKSLQLNPNFAQANQYMGDVLYGMSNFNEANHYYLQAASLYTTDADKAICYSGLYWSCRKAMNYKQAVVYVDEALKLYPRSKSYLVNRANALCSKKDLVNALADYDNVIAMYSGISLNAYDSDYLATYYKERAGIKIKMKNNNDALADLKKAVDLNPSAYMFYHLGRFYKMQLKQSENANINLQKAIDISVKNDTTSDYIYSRVMRGDKLEAINVGSRKIKKDADKKSQLIWDIYNLACVYSLSGDSVKALQYLDKALSAGFEDFDHIYNDEDWDTLRGTAGFKAIMMKHKAPIARV